MRASTWRSSSLIFSTTSGLGRQKISFKPASLSAWRFRERSLLNSLIFSKKTNPHRGKNGRSSQLLPYLILLLFCLSSSDAVPADTPGWTEPSTAIRKAVFRFNTSTLYAFDPTEIIRVPDLLFILLHLGQYLLLPLFIGFDANYRLSLLV